MPLPDHGKTIPAVVVLRSSSGQRVCHVHWLLKPTAAGRGGIALPQQPESVANTARSGEPFVLLSSPICTHRASAGKEFGRISSDGSIMS
jgi:hypothetical protein